MQSILFDLDGVLYQDDTIITGATEVVAWVRDQNIPHLFLTNTTSRPRAAIITKLAGMGIEVTHDELLTPPVAAVQWLKESQLRRIALFVSDATASEFDEFTACGEEGDADAVVVGDMGEAWDFAMLNRAFRLLMADPGCPLVALGMTRYWLSGEGLRLDVGPFIKALEYATGRDAVVLGKPARHYYQSALSLLGASPSQTVMIGDDICGDIEGAQRLGMKALLVRTGKFRDGDLSQGIHPDGVLDSIKGLPQWWSDNHAEGSFPKNAL